MSALQQRAMVHSISGVAIALYVYGPAAVGDLLRLPLQAVLLPVVILAGMLLWQQPCIRRWLRGATPQVDRATRSS